MPQDEEQTLEKKTVGTVDREKLKGVFTEEQYAEHQGVIESWLLNPEQVRATYQERLDQQRELKESMVTYVQQTENFWKSLTDPELNWKERFSLLGEALWKEYRTRKYDDVTAISLLNTMVKSMGLSKDKFGRQLDDFKKDREQLEVLVKDLFGACQRLAPEVQELEAALKEKQAAYEALQQQMAGKDVTVNDIELMEALNEAERTYTDAQSTYIVKVTDLSLSFNLANTMKEWLGVVRKNYVSALQQFHQFGAYIQKADLLVQKVGAGMDIMAVQMKLQQDAEAFNTFVNPALTNSTDLAVLTPLLSMEAYTQIFSEETPEHLRKAADMMDDVRTVQIQKAQEAASDLLTKMGYKVTPPETPPAGGPAAPGEENLTG